MHYLRAIALLPMRNCAVWQIGLEEVEREIISLRQDWGFRVSRNGVEEKCSAAAPG